MKLSKLTKRILYNNTYKYLISKYFKEVAEDINVLEEYNLYSKPQNIFINDIYDDYDLDPTMKEFITKKYEEKYCPTSLFEYFNKSEKVNYLILRNKIDKNLNLKDTQFEI
jgi:protein gp37